MSDDGFLHRYFLSNGHLPLHKWLHYFDIYSRYFGKFRDRPIRMLEIGVQGGGSLSMWRDYFHPDSQIVGIDIDPDCAQRACGNIHVHIGSQDDREFLVQVCDKYGDFDIVLDDGSHVNSHVITSFEVLYSRLSAYGIYMVEDMHTSYWAEYGGGLRKEGSFIEYAKNLIDELNASHSGEIDKTNLTKSTMSICFYDSMVVFEKVPQGKRKHFATSAMDL